ncbi:hypothetical protein FS837_003738 [Tulasnella sp. UAMH 9824]|nr:hypothetical protein FS837_003738 [Tulasnella sp. UAMH 9824]
MTGKKLFQRLVEKTESRCDGSWDKLLNLQTPAGQAVFVQDEVHSRRSLSREANPEDGIDTEERFKMLISRSLAALYTTTVRPGKKDFELKTLKVASSEYEQHETACSDEDKPDDPEGESPMDILEPEVPSSDTAMDEVNSDGLMTPIPETPPILFADQDECRTTNSSPHPSEDFTPLDEDERRDRTLETDIETTHDDIFLCEEDHHPETAEQSNLSDYGDSDSELFGSLPPFWHSPPVPSDAEKLPDLHFNDLVRIPDWSGIPENRGPSQRDYDDDVGMLDFESPLMPPDDPQSPRTSLRGLGDKHPACLDEDLLLLSPGSHSSERSLDNLDINML